MKKEKKMKKETEIIKYEKFKISKNKIQKQIQEAPVKERVKKYTKECSNCI